MSARAALVVVFGLLLAPATAAAEACIGAQCYPDLAAALAAAAPGDGIEVSEGTDDSGPWTVPRDVTVWAQG